MAERVIVKKEKGKQYVHDKRDKMVWQVIVKVESGREYLLAEWIQKDMARKEAEYYDHVKGLSARVEQKTRMNCPGCGALEGEKHRVHPCKGEVPEFWEYEQLWEDGKPVLDMRPDKEDPYIYLPYFIPFHWQHEAELPNVCPRCGLFNPRIYTVEDWGEVMPKVARGMVLCWECYRDFKEWRTGVRMDKPDRWARRPHPQRRGVPSG